MPRADGRPTTAERGYGHAHVRERQRWAAVVAAGGAICTRCGCLIVPGQLWDLDHTDDRSGYRGAAHRRCNRAAGARKGNRSPRRRRRALLRILAANPSRRW